MFWQQKGHAPGLGKGGISPPTSAIISNRENFSVVKSEVSFANLALQICFKTWNVVSNSEINLYAYNMHR